MPRKRNPENKGLPLRWKKEGGSYYYQVPKGLEHMWDGKKKFRLGGSLPEAYKVWADKITPQTNVKTVRDLLDRYALEVASQKSPSSQKRDERSIKRLRATFGDMPIGNLKPRHVYTYVDVKRKKTTDAQGRSVGGATTARQEVAVLSHAYTKAVVWGYLDAHPFKGLVRIEGIRPRDRYLEDWEISEALSLAPAGNTSNVEVIQAFIRLKLLTGLRQGDILRLKLADLKQDGIHVTTRKTGKKLIIQWSDILREEITRAKALRPVDISPFLFCSRKGRCYYNDIKDTSTAWNSMWQRYMKRLLEETKIKERFTDTDLRAKTGSDAESEDRAMQLLGHTDNKVTRKHYRRKPELIRPAK